MFSLTALNGFNAFTEGNFVISTQQVAITIGAGATSNTATISSVDTAMTFVIFEGLTSSNSGTVNNSTDRARVTLTNSTTVTATRNSTGNTVTVYAQVIYCSPNFIQNVQQGSITITAGTSNTATITSVDLTRSVVLYHGETTTNTGASPQQGQTAVALTNATTVTAIVNSTSTTTTGYVVIQFQASVIKSRQDISNTSTSASNTITLTITAVDLANSVAFYAGQAINDANWTYITRVQLLTSTSVIWFRNDPISTNTRTMNGYVIEFKPGVVKSNQNSTLLIPNSAISATATLTAVNTSKSVVVFGNNNCGLIPTSESRIGISLTNSTTLTALRGSAPAAGARASYQVLEFY